MPTNPVKSRVWGTVRLDKKTLIFVVSDTKFSSTAKITSKKLSDWTKTDLFFVIYDKILSDWTLGFYNKISSHLR